MILKFLSKNQERKWKLLIDSVKNCEDGYFAIQITKLGYTTNEDISNIYKEAI